MAQKERRIRSVYQFSGEAEIVLPNGGNAPPKRYIANKEIKPAVKWVLVRWKGPLLRRSSK